MKGPTKNWTSSPTGWLRMRFWRMSLRRSKGACSFVISQTMCSMIQSVAKRSKASTKLMVFMTWTVNVKSIYGFICTGYLSWFGHFLFFYQQISLKLYLFAIIKFNNYAPNFEEVDGAYWSWVVRWSMRLFETGMPYLMNLWNGIYGFLM